MENVTHNNISQEYVELSPGFLTFAAIVMAVSMFLGLSGNLLTVIALVKYPKERNAARDFTICLCTANFLFCASVHPIDIKNLWTDTWTHGSILCKITPFLRYANLSVSLLCIGFITMNRYILVVKRNWYECVYRKRNVAVMIAFTLVFPYTILLPTLNGIWGEFGCDKNLGVLCTIVPDESGRSAETALFVVAIVTALIITICYTRILCFVQKSKRRMREHQRSQDSAIRDARESRRVSRARRKEWKMTKMVLVTFLSYILCYLPITITKVAQLHSPILKIAGYLLLYASTCINPIIYGVMNTQYRDAYVALLRPQSRRSGLSGEAHPVHRLEPRGTEMTRF